MRVLLLALVLGAALAGTAQSAPGQAFDYDRQLGVLARETLWHAVPADERFPRTEVRRVYVRCYRDKESFERVFERRFGIPARRVIAYYAGGADIHLRSVTCDNVRAFLGGRHTVFTAAAYSILLHESLHRQGVRNERITTCLANEAVRWGALWYGFTDAQSLRARNLAFTYTRLYSPSPYFMGKPTCLALTRRSSWPELRSTSR